MFIMHPFLPLALALSLFGCVHANPLLLALAGFANSVVGPLVNEVMVRTVLKNGNSPVKLLQDPGTVLSNPNCTTLLYSNPPVGPPISCGTSDRDSPDDYEPSDIPSEDDYDTP